MGRCTGASWVQLSNGLPQGKIVNRMVFDPRRADTIYASTAAGVFVTRNAGVSWTDASAGLPPGMAGTREITVSPARPDTLYVAVLLQGDWLIYRSVDAGASWEPTPFRDSDFIYSMEAAPSDANTVYTSMEGRVVRSTDGGLGRTEASTDLPEDQVRSLGTYGRSVFSVDL